MSRFFQLISKFVAPVALAWSVPSHAVGQVNCSISAIHLPAITKSLPLGEPEYVGGHVDVLCTSALRESLTVEFALMDVQEDPPRDGSGDFSQIQVELFSDLGISKALPNNSSQVTHFPTRGVVTNAGESMVSVPIFAKVYLAALIAGGGYSIVREIGLVYRLASSPP